MLNFYAAFYLTYLKLFRPAQTAKDGFTAPQTPTSIDTEATRLGNAYRGSGVLVGILGALIIFCAVAPVGFGLLHHPGALYFGIAEVTLMIWVLLTIRTVSKPSLKERWIKTRQAAEVERYSPLKEAMHGDLTSLAAAIAPLLGGGNRCQIVYNRAKYDQYHAIENSAEKATMIGFGISLVAAALHLVVHADALIFLTALLPAAVGALHGINAFLKLEQLAHEHLDLAEELGSLKESFGQASLRDDLDNARQIAERIYTLLTQSHQGWINIANRQEVRAP